MLKKVELKISVPIEVQEEKFYSLTTFNDIAKLLEIPNEFLKEILITNKNSNYKEFVIPKKSGGNRIIHSPEKNLAIVQKKMANILKHIYKCHPAAHGFVKGKDIISNASKHLNKRYVLNFDLKDFFHTINYGRVRGMFQSYFKFNNSVSSTLANICCHHEGFLPQGSSTSPIISNIIGNQLDRDLHRFSSRYHCTYTRYVDDITISTSRNEFPNEIAFRRNYDSPTYLSDKLNDIVEKCGFTINEIKTHLRSSSENLSVTGITVNEKLNIKRSYIRYIRLLIHSLESHKKLGQIEKAEEIFKREYYFRTKRYFQKPDIYTAVRGMISYVGQVRGNQDSIYQELGRRYNNIVRDLDLPYIKSLLDLEYIAQNNTFIIEAREYSFMKDGKHKGYVYTNQGTAFLLRGIGLITAAHVITEYIGIIESGQEVSNINLHRGKYLNVNEKIEAKLLYYDSSKDIAILDALNINVGREGFRLQEKDLNDTKVKLVGYQNYVGGTDIRINTAKVRGQRGFIHHGEQQYRYEVDQPTYRANSGGPVVNEDNEVVAVTIKENEEDFNEVLPISEVRHVYINQSKKWVARERSEGIMKKKYDLFISHASEDKDEFVGPLANALIDANIDVWYDEFTLTWGDSIRQSIDKGLANSEFGLVIISQPFLKKYWTNYEMDGIFQRESLSNRNLLLPIWHNITKDEVEAKSPTLGGRKALVSSTGIDSIVTEVKKVLKKM